MKANLIIIVSRMCLFLLWLIIGVVNLSDGSVNNYSYACLLIVYLFELFSGTLERCLR